MFVHANAITPQLFQHWKQENNKKYLSDEEEAIRFDIFKQNAQKIEALNREHGQEVYGYNLFSDLTADEFADQYLMEPFDSAAKCEWPYNRVHHISQAELSSTPTSWDWRTQTPNPVTAVKDQGQCGSCWAFSTTGNIEGQWTLSGKTQPLISEQELVDCSHACLASEPSLCNGGCNGGLPWLAYEDVIKWGGITGESNYPYTAMTGNCRSSGMPNVAEIRNWTATSPDMVSIEAFLVSQGPLSMTLNANPLQSYRKGVIQPSIFSQCPSSGADHAVLLVGFGDDSSSGTSVHYWTIKNSWGSSWGEAGFFRMQADGDMCGIWDCVSSATL
jgi:cathepsin F